MLMTTLPLALAVAGAMQASTDTTFAVQQGTRIELNNLNGSVRVEVWDRNEVRVRADHGSRDRVRISDHGAVVTIRAERQYGMPIEVDYRLTLPRNAALSVGGVQAEVDVTGLKGDLHAESVEGSLTARDVGAVTLTTVEGDVSVTGATGAVRVQSTDGDVHVSRVRGNLSATTIDGDVIMDNVDANQVDVSTVDGEVHFTGPLHDGGRYRLTSHDGDVTLIVPGQVNATVTVATFDGDFDSDFPVRMNSGQSSRRFSFTLGTGSAQIELESFDGHIRLRRNQAQ